MNRKGPDLSKNSVVTGSAARKGQGGGFNPTVFENYKELLRKRALNPPSPLPSTSLPL